MFQLIFFFTFEHKYIDFKYIVIFKENIKLTPIKID